MKCYHTMVNFSRKKHSGQCRVLFSFKSAVFFDVHAVFSFLNPKFLCHGGQVSVFRCCLSGKITALTDLENSGSASVRFYSMIAGWFSMFTDLSVTHSMHIESYLPAICFSCCSIIFLTIYPPTDPFCLEVRSPL